MNWIGKTILRISDFWVRYKRKELRNPLLAAKLKGIEEEQKIIYPYISNLKNAESIITLYDTGLDLKYEDIEKYLDVNFYNQKTFFNNKEKTQSYRERPVTTAKLLEGAVTTAKLL